jgi:hypothetical protein
MSGIEPIQEYNQMLKRHLLNSIRREIIEGSPQPSLFGGKRMRNFVLPSSTEYDYPSSLSVGQIGSQPDLMGGSFWKDFSKGFKTGFTGVANVAAPIVKEVGVELLKEGVKSAIRGEGRHRISKCGGYLIGRNGEVRARAKEDMTGAGIWDSFKSGVKTSVNSLKKEVEPIAKDVLNDVIIPEGKDMLKKSIKEKLKSKPNPSVEGGAKLTKEDILKDLEHVSKSVGPFIPIIRSLKRSKKSLPPHPIEGGNWADDLKKVSSAIAPFAPLLLGLGRGKQPSKAKINSIIKSGGNWLDDVKKVSETIAPFAPLLLGLGRAKRKAPKPSTKEGVDLGFEPHHTGGVLIRDDPSQFQIQTGIMPPALASYNPPKARVARVTGGKKAAAKKPSARGAIVSKVMKEKGLSLGAASKYVKEHGLY